MPNKPTDEPSKKEIAEMCREIQESWTPEQRESRMVGYSRERWTVPQVKNTKA